MLLSWEGLKSQVKTLNLLYFAGSCYFSYLLLRSGGLSLTSGKTTALKNPVVTLLGWQEELRL